MPHPLSDTQAPPSFASPVITTGELPARVSDVIALRRRGDDPFAPIVAESAPMLDAIDRARRLARTDLPLFLEGETGTGKELLAECIHAASPRALGPLIVVDAGAVDPGHAAAVLGGDEQHPGAIERAHGGTLYVASIDALDRVGQARLLRAIERGLIARAGDSAGREIDVRLIASSRRSLEPLVARGGMIEELFFRLAGTKVELPALREREGDVALLARHLFGVHSADVAGMSSLDAACLADEFLIRRSGYTWPGNVRELDGAVASSLALGDDADLPSASGDAPAALQHSATATNDDVIRQIVEAGLRFSDARARVLEAFERAYVEAALARSGGNITRAAAEAGVARRSFQTIRARRRT